MSKNEITLQLVKYIIDNSSIAELPDSAMIVARLYNEIYLNISATE